MATNEETRSARAARLDTLHEQLTASVEQLVTGDDWRRSLQFAARFRSRSFGNTLLIWSQHLARFEQGRVPHPQPTYVAGYERCSGSASGRGRWCIRGSCRRCCCPLASSDRSR